MKNRRNRRVNRGKTKLTATVLVVLVLGLIFIMGNETTASYPETNYKTIYVSSGDTLWEIAKIELANNNYFANSDVRYIVKEIRDLNKLDSSSLYPGQELLVPCY